MILLDTDVFSFVFRGDTRGAFYESELRGRTACLSFMSVAELKRWAIRRNWGRSRRESLARSIRGCTVLGFDDRLTDLWAEVTAHRERLGRPIACGDCWIAATALAHGMPLATHNAADFADIPDLVLVTREP
jgi:predicted nucleic acid-binding protein